MKFIVLYIFFILISMCSQNNEDNILIIKNQECNDFIVIIKEAQDEENVLVFDFNLEKNKLENQKNNYLNFIFIHGSASGMHTYYKNPGGSFLGLLRNIREQIYNINVFKKSYQQFYKNENNRENQLNYKGKKDLFMEDKLPLIMGPYYGLYEIKDFYKKNNKNIEHTITKTAYYKILIPFLKNCKKYSMFSNNIITSFVFNWAGDLNNLDRSTASKLFSKELVKLNTRLGEDNKEYNNIIIGFSHGGNVLLEALKNFKYTCSNNIKYICLLGTPISQKTNKWASEIDDNVIILNFYSNNDVAQLDPSYELPHCNRFIDAKKKNIYNIRIEFERIDGKISHPKHEHFYLYNYQYPNILLHIPHILEKINIFINEDLKGEKNDL